MLALVEQLHIVIVDLRKAFDLNDRESLIPMLDKAGWPEALFILVKTLHSAMHGRVQYDGDL